MRRGEVSTRQLADAAALYADGVAVLQIERRLGIRRGLLIHYVRRYTDLFPPELRRPPGHPYSLDADDAEEIAAMRRRGQSVDAIAGLYCVCPRTVRRALRRHGYGLDGRRVVA